MTLKKFRLFWLVYACCCVAYLLWAPRQKNSHAQAILKLRHLGARVTFADRTTKQRAHVNLARTAITDDDLVILHEVHHLEKLNLANTATTDQGLARLAGLSHLIKLNLGQTKITNQGLEHLRELPNLSTLILDGTPITDSGLDGLKDLPQLTTLSLCGTSISDAGLARLGGIPNLASLTLATTRISDAGLANLQGLPSLRSLDLGGTQLSDAGLPHLQGIPNLTSLTLCATRVTDRGLVHLRKLAGLRSLNLSGLNITDAGMRHLGDLPGLDSLVLTSTGITDRGLTYLKDRDLVRLDVSYTLVTDKGLNCLSGTRLRELRVNSFLPTYPAGVKDLAKLIAQTEQVQKAPVITDRGVAGLRKFPQLQVLQLGNSQVTDAGLEYLAGLTNLKDLHLRGADISDAGLRHLRELNNLEVLDLGATRITSAGLGHLRGLGELQILTLAETDITGAGLAHLVDLPMLHDLDLSGTDVGDAGLEHLAGILSLAELNLGCTRVTDAGLKHLTKLTQLEQLSLSEDQVTEQGLEQLRHLPNLQEISVHLTEVGEETAQRFLEGENPILLRINRRQDFIPERPGAAEKEAGDDPDQAPAGGKVDQYGDPLPPGARAQLGTNRFWQRMGYGHLALSPDRRLLASTGEFGRIHLWETSTGRLVRVIKAYPNRVQCVAFAPDGRRLAAGGEGAVGIWEPASGKRIRNFAGSWLSVDALAFSPDGKALAMTTNFPAGVRVLDVTSGRQLLQLRPERDRRKSGGGSGSFSCLAFAPDGKALAAGGQASVLSRARKKFGGRERVVLLTSPVGRVWVWQLPTGNLLSKLESHNQGLGGLAFAPKGKRIVTAGQDQALRVWDIATGKRVQQMDMGARSIFTDCLAVAPNGRAFVATEGTVQVWDLETGKRAGTWNAPATGLALSRDGRSLALMDSFGFLSVRDTATGRERVPVSRHGGWGIHAVACSPNGKTVATAGYDRVIRVWESATGREIRILDGGTLDIGQLGFSPDSRRLLATASRRGGPAGDRRGCGKVLVWDVATGKKVFETGDDGWAGTTADAAVLGSVTTLAAARTAWTDRNGKPPELSSFVVVLDIRTGKLLRELSGQRRPIWSLTLTPDEHVVAWGSDGMVRVADVGTGKELRVFSMPGDGRKNPVRAISFSPNGKLLAAAGASGTTFVWKWRSGKQLFKFSCPGQPAQPALQFLADGRLLAAADGSPRPQDRETSEVSVWDVSSGKRIGGPFRTGSYLTTLALARNGTFLAAGYHGPTVLLWDLTGKAGADGGKRNSELRP